MLLKSVIERLDREQFEDMFGYSIRPGDTDSKDRLYRGTFDHFRDMLPVG